MVAAAGATGRRSGLARCASSTCGTRSCRSAGVEEFTAGLAPSVLRKAQAAIAKARTRDSLHAFEKLTHLVDGEPRIISDPPLIVPIDELLPTGSDRDVFQTRFRTLSALIGGPSRPTAGTCSSGSSYVDLARKVVGVGSVGTRAWIVLLLGRDDEDPLFLQIKEAQPSVLEQFVGRSDYANYGQRVVAGQRLMQAASDIFLGWRTGSRASTASSGTSTSAS